MKLTKRGLYGWIAGSLVFALYACFIAWVQWQDHKLHVACMAACNEPDPPGRQLQKTLVCNTIDNHHATAVCLVDPDHAVVKHIVLP